MGIRDLVPWGKGQELSTGREAFDPFLTLHREMNRLFDDAFRGFGSFGRINAPLMEGQFSWPRLELNETDKEVRISAELPGLSEKDVQVEIANSHRPGRTPYSIVGWRAETRIGTAAHGMHFSRP